MQTKILLTAGAATLMVIFAIIVIRRDSASVTPLIFSPTQVLASSWYDYKKTYIEPSSHRTIDPERGNSTTSEGQSYTMLRAVWQGDEPTFDASWQWTETNLQHPSDHLLSWLWGAKSDGTYGILTASNGQNSASDADTDTALALIFAYARWQDPNYMTSARAIIQDIWNKEVVMIQDKPYLAADDIEKVSPASTIVVNPSYFNPAAYHLFALVDSTHPWEALRSNAYAVLRDSSSDPLGSNTSSGLPPDWLMIDKKTGTIAAIPATDHDTSFGYDALRIPFRVALDAEWFHNPDATSVLKRFSFLSTAWASGSGLASAYRHDGSVSMPGESAAMYGGTLGYFMVQNPQVATDMYRQKLLSLYDANTGGWSPILSYYDNNWAWFGIALYNGQLPNLAADLPRTAFTGYSSL